MAISMSDEYLGHRPQPITLPDDAQFFIAICQSDRHSFIALGAINPHNQKKHVLCSVGFMFDNRKENYTCTSVGKMCFNNAPGVFKSDPAFHKAHGDENKRAKRLRFRYKAFDISRTQFDHFIAEIVSTRPRRHGIYCYQPDLEQPEQWRNRAIFNHNVGDPSDAVEAFKARTEHIGRSNTCRHVALAAVECGFPQAGLTANISRNFLSRLPFQACYYREEIETEFYRLPLPPMVAGLDPGHADTLQRLYRRLEELPRKYTRKRVTRTKFAKLKSLYLDLVPQQAQPVLTLKQLFDHLNEWERINLQLLNRHRSFFHIPGRTQSKRMLDKIKTNVANAHHLQADSHR